MKFFIFEPETVRNAAFYFTLVESVSGLIVSILCVLLYFCTFRVTCPEPHDQFSSILFTFYESYFIGPRCSFPEGIDLYIPNNSSFTRPEVIFYWQASSIALYLVWLSTAYIIYQTKPATVNSCVYWIILTIIISTIDIVFSCFIITDYKNLPSEEDVNNCPFPDLKSTTTEIPVENNTTYNRNIATTILLLYSSRGGVFLIINLYLSLCVASNLDEMKRFSRKTKSLNNEDISKTNRKPVSGKQVSEHSGRGSYLDKVGRPTLPEGTSHTDIYNRRSQQPVDNDLDNAFDFLDSYPENRRNDPIGFRSGIRRDMEETSNEIRRYGNGEVNGDTRARTVEETKNEICRYGNGSMKGGDTPGRRMEGLGFADDESEKCKDRQDDVLFNIPRAKIPIVVRSPTIRTGTAGVSLEKEQRKSTENKDRRTSSGSNNQQKAADYGPRRYFIPLKD